MNIKGGTTHSGKEITIASMAEKVETSVQTMLLTTEPPCRIAKWAKRRCTTRLTKAGPIIKETANRESTTKMGVIEKITTKGTRTPCKLTAPWDCIQSIMLCMTCQEARNSLTQSWVGCQ